MIAQNKRRALILASVASMIEQFNFQNIKLLLDNGFDVDVACNCKEGNTISEERVKNMINELSSMGVSVIHVPIPRKITSFKSIQDSFLQVKELCNEKKYTLLHCHSPIGSVVARFAVYYSRKNYGTKVIYTAHGFHFYKGAPVINWLIFFPIEKICSKMTDVLITINKEDYFFAKKHMSAKQIEYIPGVGVETNKFYLKDDFQTKKKIFGLKNDDIVILSVGELNKNKNHQVIIRAISKLKNANIHYFIAGKGNQEEYLKKQADELHVNLHLLGYRTDIIELLNMADIFVFPSFREGLSVALMEAMSAGLPCIVSDIRGNTDLIDSKGGFLCRPNNADDFSLAIKELLNEEKRKCFGKHNRVVMKQFDVQCVMEKISKIYNI